MIFADQLYLPSSTCLSQLLELFQNGIQAPRSSQKAPHSFLKPNQFIIIKHQSMFCCLTGNNKKELPSKMDRKDLPKTKKPEDFMREDIPLALSEKIKLTFHRTHKWSCEVVGEAGRARKKEVIGVKAKLENMREKLKRMQMENDQLAERAKNDQKTDDQLTVQLAKLKAQCQALQWAIANSKLQIRKCKERVAA